MGKLPFNVGARGVYIAPPEDFHASKYTGIRWLWRPIANPQWGNQMRPRRWSNAFDYPWQDLWDMRWNSQSRRFFDVFRRRSHFYTPCPPAQHDVDGTHRDHVASAVDGHHSAGP